MHSVYGAERAEHGLDAAKAGLDRLRQESGTAGASRGGPESGACVRRGRDRQERVFVRRGPPRGRLQSASVVCDLAEAPEGQHAT